MLRLVLILTAAAVAASTQTVRMIEVEGEARKYWSQWRGPSGQGIVEGKGYPDTWSGTENVRWKVKVPERAGNQCHATRQFRDYPNERQSAPRTPVGFEISLLTFEDRESARVRSSRP